jgi:hypothetical protein
MRNDQVDGLWSKQALIRVYLEEGENASILSAPDLTNTTMGVVWS